MWKWLYLLASPAVFYRISGYISRYLGWAALLMLTIGLGWGLIFAPSDYQQGEAYRIIYLHVPCAFLSIMLFASMGFFAILLLVWRIKIAGLMLINTARIGAMMALIALLTGSIWGKPMWGAWWVWDARLTSELILFILYLAILAIHQAVKQTDNADKLASILALVGLLDLPVIHYSVYWWNTLHQGATLTVLSQPKIASSMLYPLLISMFGFGFFVAWFCITRAREELLWREKRQSWVKKIVSDL